MKEGEERMKKRIGMLLTALALLASNAASLGCIVFVVDEPTAPKNFD